MLANQHLIWKAAGATTRKKGAAVNFNRRFFAASFKFCPTQTTLELLWPKVKGI
jgi:hypothetical protein